MCIRDRVYNNTFKYAFQTSYKCQTGCFSNIVTDLITGDYWEQANALVRSEKLKKNWFFFWCLPLSLVLNCRTVAWWREWLTWQMTIASLSLQVAIEPFPFQDLPLETQTMLVLSLFSPECRLSHILWYCLWYAVVNILYRNEAHYRVTTCIGITECAKCITETLKCDNVGMLFQTWRDMMTLTPNLRKIICLVTVDLVCLLLVGIPCLLLWLVGKFINLS